MRAILFILILGVVAAIIAVATGFLDIRQTRQAEVPAISTTGSGVRAEGGQAPIFEVETGTVAVGARQSNVTVPVPRVEVRPPRPGDAAGNAAVPAVPPQERGTTR